MDAKDGIELREDYIVLSIPSDAVEIEVHAKVYIDGEVIPVMKTMNFQEIREAFKEAEDYIPPDAEFELTDLGRKFAEQMKLDSFI